MLLALKSGVIPLAQVEETARFLVEIMPVMFIPAAVGLMTAFAGIQSVLPQMLLIIAVTTVLVMGVTGLVTQAAIRLERRRRRRGGKSDGCGEGGEQ
jgi:holin-like protein